MLMGISHVNILLAAMAARWAGDRVICLTENTRNEDLPSTLLTEAEKQELSEVHWSYPSDLFGLVCDRFKKPTRYSGAAFHVFTAQLGRLESQRFDMLSIPDYPNDPPWVLCNLSKGEYFRAEAVRDLTGHAFIGPFKRNRTGVGLGEILLFRICLSPASMYKGNIRPGVWAGDRFAITTVRGMERLRGTAAWKDISEEITKELLAIVEDTYGDQWIEYV
ncbi:hypothetical protein A0H81_03968 [Grifola frondosa]|uniref:Uncharacterized protein n=1 Tax=Grifola frondosa TaxID=5627 RepID=A0A1C7MH01_GRIFR|nr:hypothetical protein A0H81_03968 [Grifola frondosa]